MRPPAPCAALSPAISSHVPHTHPAPNGTCALTRTAPTRCTPHLHPAHCTHTPHPTTRTPHPAPHPTITPRTHSLHTSHLLVVPAVGHLQPLGPPWVAGPRPALRVRDVGVDGGQVGPQGVAVEQAVDNGDGRAGVGCSRGRGRVGMGRRTRGCGTRSAGQQGGNQEAVQLVQVAWQGNWAFCQAKTQGLPSPGPQR